MNRFTLRVQKLWKSAKTWSRDFSPKLQLWIDKYKVVKVGCVLGVGINGIYAYNGLLDVIVLSQVREQIEDKKQIFYRRMDARKKEIMAIMNELETEVKVKS